MTGIPQGVCIPKTLKVHWTCLAGDRASSPINSELKQTGVMCVKPDMQSKNQCDVFLQEFLDAEEPRLDGICKPYARDISPLSARWEKWEWSHSVDCVFPIAFSLWCFVACWCFLHVRFMRCVYRFMFPPFMVFVCSRGYYMTPDMLTVYTIPCYAVCGIRAMPIVRGTRSVYKVAVRLV